MVGMDPKDGRIEQLERVVAERATVIEKLVQRVDELDAAATIRGGPVWPVSHRGRFW